MVEAMFTVAIFWLGLLYILALGASMAVAAWLIYRAIKAVLTDE